MALDIFSPQISTLTYGMEGKTILIYGTNRTGKTKQLSKLTKPCYLAFESGLNAIDGIPFFSMRKWSDFVLFVKKATNEDTLAKVKEMYQTIIVDEASIVGRLCSEFICEKFGVDRINDGKPKACRFY